MCKDPISPTPHFSGLSSRPPSTCPHVTGHHRWVGHTRSPRTGKPASWWSIINGKDCIFATHTHTHTCAYVHKHARVCMCTFAQACAPFSTCMLYSCSSQNQTEGQPLQYRRGVQDPEKLGAGLQPAAVKASPPGPGALSLCLRSLHLWNCSFSFFANTCPSLPAEL